MNKKELIQAIKSEVVAHAQPRGMNSIPKDDLQRTYDEAVKLGLTKKEFGKLKSRKSIFSTSDYDKAIKILLTGVSDDTAKVTLPQSAGGNTYTSKCSEVENEYGRFLVTIFKKDNKIIGKEVYNYETEEATEFVYDMIQKVFIKVEEVTE